MARVASYTDKGRRPSNQDALCVRVASTTLGEVSMAVVCDGVGGLSGGEVASATVVGRFADWFDRDLPRWLEGHLGEDQMAILGLRGVWQRLLRLANAELVTYGREHGGTVGTTFTGVACLGGRYLVGHVGDCRAYLVGDEGTRRLTDDQTLAAHEVALGRMDEAEAERSPKRTVLLQSIGTQPTVEPSFRQGAYQAGDLFVIASDGAWHLQGDAGIDRCFRTVRQADESVLAQRCRDLCEVDLQHGEGDNLSVACLGPELAAADLDATQATEAL